MTFTLAPAIPPTFFDGSTIAASYQLFVYLAGTTTKTTTYLDSAGAASNTNPIILDSAGRATIFLDPTIGAVKFVLAPADDTDPPTDPVWTRDNILPVSDLSGDTVIVDDATAGEDLLTTDCCYQSAGSGSLTAGLWYKTSSNNDYSSTLATNIGYPAADIDQGDTGRMITSGIVTGLSGLSAGFTYLVGPTPGTLVDTLAADPIRIVGGGLSSTELLLYSPKPPGAADEDRSGLVSATTQTIGGAKTLTDALTLDAGFASPPLGVPTYSRCDTTLTKNASITLEDVSGLAFSVGASEVWAFQFYLYGISASAARFKYTLTGPGSPTAVRFGVVSMEIGPATGSASAFASTVTAGGTTVDQAHILHGLLRNGANAGTVQLQFAQNNSDASDSKIYVESYVLAWRIS